MLRTKLAVCNLALETKIYSWKLLFGAIAHTRRATPPGACPGAYWITSAKSLALEQLFK